MKPYLLIAALTITACGPGADRTPKKAGSQPMKTLAESPLNARIEGGRIFSGGTMPHIVFREGGTFSIAASREKPLYSIDFDGGKWCDVYADARGLHWKDCKTGESSDDTPQLFSRAMDLVEEVRELRARLKMLENPPPAYHADPSWNVYVEPIEDVPHYAPCGEGRSSNIVDAKTGKPLCRVDASKGGKPHDGEVRPVPPGSECAYGYEIYRERLDKWVCLVGGGSGELEVNAPKLDIDQAFGDVGMKAGTTIQIPSIPTAPWPGDKAPEPADHIRGMPGEKGGKQ